MAKPNFSEKDLEILLSQTKDPNLKKKLEDFQATIPAPQGKGKKQNYTPIRPPAPQSPAPAPKPANATPAPAPPRPAPYQSKSAPIQPIVINQPHMLPAANQPLPQSAKKGNPPPPKHIDLRQMMGKFGADAKLGMYRGLPGFLKTALLGNSDTILNKPFDAWTKSRYAATGGSSGQNNQTNSLLKQDARARSEESARNDASQQRLQAVQEETMEQNKSQLALLSRMNDNLGEIKSLLEINGKQVGAAMKASAANGAGGSDLLTTAVGGLLGGKLLGGLKRGGGAILRGGRGLLSKIPGLGKLAAGAGAAVGAEKIAEKVATSAAPKAAEEVAAHAASPGIKAAEEAATKIGPKGLFAGALQLAKSGAGKILPGIGALGKGLFRAGTEAGGLAVDAGLGAYQGYKTDTDTYAHRFGMQHSGNSLVGDLALRTGGVAQDVGNSIHDGFGSLVNLIPNLMGKGDVVSNWTDEQRQRDMEADGVKDPNQKTVADLITGKDKKPESSSVVPAAATAAGLAAATAAMSKKDSRSATMANIAPAMATAAGTGTTHAAAETAAHGGRFSGLKAGGKALGKWAPLLATGYFTLSDLMKKDDKGKAAPDLLGAGLNATAGASSYAFAKSKNPLARLLGPLLEFTSAGIHGSGEYDEEREKAEKDGKPFNALSAAGHIGSKVMTGEFLPKFMAESLPEILEHSEHHGAKKGIMSGLMAAAKGSPKLAALLLGGLGTGIFATHAHGEKTEGKEGEEAHEDHQEASENHEEAQETNKGHTDAVEKNTDALESHIEAVKKEDNITTDATSAINSKSTTSILASMLDMMNDKDKGIYIRQASSPFDNTLPGALPSANFAPKPTVPTPGPGTVSMEPHPDGGHIVSSYHPASEMTPEEAHNKLVTSAGFRGSVTPQSGVASGLGGRGSVAPTSVMGNGPSDDKKANEEMLRKEMISRGITDPKTQANFLANFQAESSMVPQSEKISEARANATMQNNKNLGNKDPGDGYKFRGRGFVQLTGRANYADLSKKLFGDDRLVKNPDLANDPKIAAKIALEYHVNRLKSRGIDPNKASVDDVTKSEAPADIAGEIANRRKLVSRFDPTDSKGKVAALMAGNLTPAGQSISAQMNASSNEVASTSKAGGPAVVPVTIPVPTSSSQQPASNAGLQTSMTTTNNDSAIKALTLNFMSDSMV
jgi:predicted chitinase